MPGGRVALRQVVAPGAALPGDFGPARLRAAGEGDQTLHALEGDALLEARVRAPAGRTASARVRWDFDAGWTVALDDGPPASLVPSAARGVREALTFAWEAHGQQVPLDLVFVFRATQGGGEALARAVVEAVERLAAAASSDGADVRLRAVAVGDHPQGHLRPAFVTLAQPGWTDRPDEVAAWVAERLRQPVDGIDAPEAYECALREAAGLDWRADATRLLVVLADAPAHTPDAPPYCPVDWRAEARRLKDQGVRLAPVHVAVAGAPPALRRQVLAFLEGLGEVLTLRGGGPGADLLGVVAAAARARRLDPAARRVLEAVAFEEA
ncbi:MAG: VWA domain-containing protein [Planctomycetes bacterium]|nr:VWA domain-containing protein [Planctomycetota bacterium]